MEATLVNDSPEKREKVMSLRVTRSEYAYLRQLCSSRDLSSYIRKAILAEYVPKTKPAIAA
jgi:hypothetical protein